MIYIIVYLLRIVHIAFIPYYTSKLCGDRETLDGDSCDNPSVLNVNERCSKAEWRSSLSNDVQSFGDLVLPESIKIVVKTNIKSITLG